MDKKDVSIMMFSIALLFLITSCKNETAKVPTDQQQIHKTSIEEMVDTTRKEGTRIIYKEISYPTPKYDKKKVNMVRGVILHHTAEPTVKRSLEILTTPEKGVSTHVVIDTDGTRYILASPQKVTYHAGLSVLNGMEGCNDFTIGIEFQGNTLESPLTDDQINSAIEYLLPIIDNYNITLDDIVTHEMVRNAYKKKHPNKRCSGKVDITQNEYSRFMKTLRSKMRLTTQ